MDMEIPSSVPAAAIVYRCKICSIESPEPSCFAAIATEGPYRMQGTCITCNQPAREQAMWRRGLAFIALIAGPPTYLAATRGVEQIGLIGLVIIAVLIHPLLVILHELAHALTARAVGLEVTLVRLGSGPFVWAGKALSFPVRLYAWPLSGLTHLSGHPAQWVRTRVWLTVLMGPLSNLVLAGAASVFWNPLSIVMDSNVTLLWIVYNALMGAGNLWPHRTRGSEQSHSSDGRQLIQIPFQKPGPLAEALNLGAAGAIFVAYKDGDYWGAKAACIEELEHLPGNPYLLMLLAASNIDLGNYELARAAVEPLLSTTAAHPPQLHAAAQNNLALALWFRDFSTPGLEQSLQRADALAADAYRKYPCVLAHRSTRALLLAATSRSEEALELLRYTNYDRGSRDARSHREFARAFALRLLDRNEEADQALAAGLKLSKKQLPWLITIGLIPATAKA
jgi:tetratricopeptide (TPR) repeat protein